MKNILLKSFALVFGILLIQSCKSDKVVEQVDAAVTSGAILRTVRSISTTFDIVDLSSTFSIEIEEQDAKDGALMSNVKVYVKKAGGTEVLFNTLSPSAFSTGPNGLPRTIVTISLQEALDALGLTDADISCGGVMSFRLELALTDGRVFTASNTSGTVSGGSFFSSPFAYNVPIVANLPSDTLYTGQYQLTTINTGIFGVSDYLDGVYTIEAISNTERVIKAVTTFPAFGGFGPVDVKFSFICGEIVMGAGNGVGAGCSAQIASGPADVNTTYNIITPDDSTFIINFTSDETSDCGGPPVQASIRLDKL